MNKRGHTTNTITTSNKPNVHRETDRKHETPRLKRIKQTFLIAAKEILAYSPLHNRETTLFYVQFPLPLLLILIK